MTEQEKWNMRLKEEGLSINRGYNPDVFKRVGNSNDLEMVENYLLLKEMGYPKHKARLLSEMCVEDEC